MPFVFSVGVTGHRQDALPKGARDSLRQRLTDVLGQLRDEALAVHSANLSFFAPDPPRILFISPLADGADQMSAEIALGLGFELHAVLPFSRQCTRDDLPDDDARGRLDALLASATRILELPGARPGDLAAYVMAGRATVAYSDVLIAVWDGQPPRGRGGTAEVVRLAFERGAPVIHVPPGGDSPTTILWGGFDPVLCNRIDDPDAARPFDRRQMGDALALILAPPGDGQEREFIRLFQSERHRRFRPRIEYPLLLTLAGVSSFRMHHWRDMSITWTRAEWAEFRDACDRAGALEMPIGALQLWYEWADSLAGHFAQSHRSGHVFNFVLGAVAVLLGTANLILPRWAIYLETSLFVVVLAILANTWAANRQQWHRRWLDYRQLAERLRPMRSLKLLGVAAPNPPGRGANPVPSRWLEWYAAAVWRATGSPRGRFDGTRLGELVRSIAEHEIDPQVSYHRTAAHRGQRLHHRLEVFGTTVFALALLSSIVLLWAFAFAPAWVHDNYNWFTVLSAGLPAIGTAAVGIRVQGDHAAGAARSEQTANVLEQLGEHLRAEDESLLRAADLTERAAQTMLGDLNEWRLLTQQRGLSVG